MNFQTRILVLVFTLLLAGVLVLDGCAGGMSSMSPPNTGSGAARSASGSGRGNNMATFTYTTLDVPGGQNTQPRAISNNGIVVGSFETGSGDFITMHGFIFQKGNFTTLDFPNSPLTAASGVNNSGVVVGTYSNVTANPPIESSFMFQNGQFTNIDCAGGNSPNMIEAAGITDSGVVVETLSNSTRSGTTIMLRSPDGSCQQAGIPSDFGQAFAEGINNSLDLSAEVEDSGGFLQNAAIREQGNWTRVDFPLIGGINNRDDVVGDSDISGKQGLLLRKGNKITIAFPGAAFTMAVGLNDKDVIVGNYSTNQTNFPLHGFIATPK